MLTRRSFLRGAMASPVIITTPGLLMPVRALEKPWVIDWNPSPHVLAVNEWLEAAEAAIQREFDERVVYPSMVDLATHGAAVVDLKPGAVNPVPAKAFFKLGLRDVEENL